MPSPPSSAAPSPPSPPSSPASADLDRAADFLGGIAGDGRIAVCAIVPDGPLAGATFALPSDHPVLVGWLTRHTASGANLYYTLNEPKPAAGHTGKAGRIREEDVAAIRGVALDLDPIEAAECEPGGLARERVRLLGLATELGRSAVPPTYLVDSGGGVQAVWLLETQLPADPETKAMVRAQAVALAKRYGGDAVQSLDHLLRIPFTMNRPNEKKRTKGRQLALSGLLGSGPRVSDLTTLRALAEPIAPTPRDAATGSGIDMGAVLDAAEGAAPLPPHLMAVVDRMRIEAPRLERLLAISDRSARDFALAARCIESGLTDPTDVALVTFSLSPEKLLEKEEAGRAAEYAEATVGRALAKTRPRLTVETAFDEIPEDPSDGAATGAARSGANSSPDIVFAPRPFRLRDPGEIPARDWLYGGHYLRGYVSATVAPGGVGKSSLAITEALAMVSGRPLLGVAPTGMYRAWIWNGEDDAVELERRITAACIAHGLSADDLGDRLRADSGRDVAIVTARQTQSGTTIAEPVVSALVSALKRERIDVFVVDPFISSHQVQENDNPSIDRVAKTWARIAHEAGCAVELVHHVRKTNGNEVTTEDSRGAGSLMAAVRSGRAINRMTVEEGRRLGLERRHLWFFRFNANAKANFSPPPATDETTWFEFRSVPLGNGDSVGVVTRHALNVPTAEENDDSTGAILAEIGERAWREDHRAAEWIGHPVAVALGKSTEDQDDRAHVRRTIRMLLDRGILKLVMRDDDKRRPRKFIVAAAQTEGGRQATGGVFA